MSARHVVRGPILLLAIGGCVAGLLLGRRTSGDTPPGPAETAQSSAPDGESCGSCEACSGGACASDTCTNDPCGAGACNTPPDACHTATGATCDATTGACSYPVQVCLYTDPQHEGPVRGDPGDVLVLGGLNFAPGAIVAYQAVSDTTHFQPALPPTVNPGQRSTAKQGTLPTLVEPNAPAVPSSVKVVLPAVMTAGQSYALWVGNPTPGGSNAYTWSQGALINDARPMWVSPGSRASCSNGVACSAGVPCAAGFACLDKVCHGSAACTGEVSWAYASAARPGIGGAPGRPPGRTLKIVGRNLEAAPNARTTVTFVNTATSTRLPPLDAADDGNSATQIERYVAQVTLPVMIPGSYAIRVSRDGRSSTELLNADGSAALLTILPDPPPPAQPSRTAVPGPSVSVADFGDAVNPCSPTDTLDDTSCVTQAILAAQALTGGTVLFPPGNWIINQTYRSLGGGFGITVPRGVNLVGATAAGQAPYDPTAPTQPPLSSVATIVIGPDFDVGVPLGERTYLFFLEGNNQVENLRFADLADLPAVGGPGTLKDPPQTQVLILNGDDSTVTHTLFDGPLFGLGTLGSTTQHGLVITGNAFGTWADAVFLAFAEDSVISNNVFWPGGDTAVDGSATVAGYWGGRHVDVSENLLDGTNTTYAAAGFPGWVNGIFFPNLAPLEELLVAGNTIYCDLGSDAGNSAIAFDSNGDVPAFHVTEVVTAVSAGSSVITVQPSAGDLYQAPVSPGCQTSPDEPCTTTDDCYVEEDPGASWTCVNLLCAEPCTTSDDCCNVAAGSACVDGGCAAPDPDLAIPSYNLNGRWLYVVAGPGLGQSRKITVAAQAASGGPIQLTVSPPFDVPPAASVSRVWVGNGAWQTYLVDNEVDNSNARCPAVPSAVWSELPGWGGNFYVGSSMVDSVIESSAMTDTAGILLYTTYGPALGQYSALNLDYFVDIHGNSVNGWFGQSSGVAAPPPDASSGILLSTSEDGNASPLAGIPGFAVTVARNALTNAGGYQTSTGVPVSTASAIAIGGNDTYTLPSFVDTVVANNVVTMAGLPSWVTLTHLDEGVSNGANIGTSFFPYPQGTVVCGDAIVDVSAQYLDDVPPSGSSTLTTCPAQ